MATFRSSHIQPDTIAMVPVHGYINKTNYSPDSIRWLDFVSATQGVRIQHALNETGERKIAGVSVDGFCAENNTVYQYQVKYFLSQVLIKIVFSFPNVNFLFAIFRVVFSTDVARATTETFVTL